MQNISKIIDLRHKEVINLHNGMRLGYVYDAEINFDTGTVTSLIIPGALKFFGILGRFDDIVIPWEKIQKIGDDIILVNFEYNFDFKQTRKFLKF